MSIKEIILLSACLSGHLVRYNGADKSCRFAIMTDGSPTCGSPNVYDGASSGVKVPGEGVAAALLRQQGIENPRVPGSIDSPLVPVTHS